MVATQGEDITLTVGMTLKNLKAQAAQAKAQLRQAFQNNKGIDMASKSFGQAEKRLESFNRTIQGSRVEFAGWAMSIMFFGMLLQRVFSSIWRHASRTFQEVMQSTEDSTNGFTMLEGSMKYLGFTLGQALEPIAMSLIPIIDRIAEWVTLNPELAAGIVKWGAILGAIFMVGGSGVLAVNGFRELAILATQFKTALAASAGGKGALGFLATPVGAGVVAALIAIGAVSWLAFSKTPKAWEALKEAFSSVDFSTIRDAVGQLFQTITGMPLELDNLAWTLAWVAAVGIEGFKGFINVLAAVVSALASVINFAKAGWLQIQKIFASGDKQDEIDKQLQAVHARIGTNIENVAKSIKNSINAYNNQAETALLGVGGFKNQQLAKQALEASLNTPSNILPGAPFNKNFLESQPTVKDSILESNLPFVVKINLDGNQLAEAIFPRLIDAIDRS